jgi:hypothetical protein
MPNYSVVISASTDEKDRQLADRLFHALCDELCHTEGEERVYRELNTTLQAWKDVCKAVEKPGVEKPVRPFFVVIHSRKYEQDQRCRDEFNHLLGLRLPNEDWTVLYTDPVGPRWSENFAAARRRYIPACPPGPPPSQDVRIRDVLDLISRNRPELIPPCPCRHLLRLWHEPAAKHWPLRPLPDGTPRPEWTAADQHQSSLALAAAIGFSEQLARRLRVVRCLNAIAQRLREVVEKTTEANQAGQPFSPDHRDYNDLIGNVRRTVRDLLAEFQRDRRRYSSDQRGADGDARRLDRFRGYLIRHTGGGDEEESTAQEYVNALDEMLANRWWNAGVTHDMLTKLRGILYQTIDYTVQIAAKFPEYGGQMFRLEGGAIAGSAEAYSRKLASYLWKGSPYHGS